MSAESITPGQKLAARWAGFLYLFTNATAIFAFVVRRKVIASGDPAQTAKNLIANERMFRTAIVAELVTVAGVIALVVALYIVLKPIGRKAALLATFWRLTENFVLTVVVLSEFAALYLVSGGNTVKAVDPTQVQALAYTCFRIYGAGFQVGFFFLGIGSALFAWLWWKSRYIPRVLAAIGFLGAIVMAGVELTKIIVPDLAAAGTMAYMAPIAIFEFGGGFWLLIRGVREPK